MTASYLIGLREGLECTLVVSILIAFLVKSDQRRFLPHVWAGVTAAAALSLGFGALLTYTQAHLTTQQAELFDALASTAAVGFVTWMIFWMRRMARQMAGVLRTQLAEAVKLGASAVALMAFLAVAREGLETALLFYSAVQGATTTAGPLVAILGGIATSIALGWLMYATAVRINLTVFFRWTGVLLVLVAAGIAKYAMHDFQESGAVPGLNDLAFDLTGTVAPDAWYAELLRGMFNVTLAPSVLETVAWVAYAVPVLTLFLLPGRRRPAVAPAQPATAGTTNA